MPSIGIISSSSREAPDAPSSPSLAIGGTDRPYNNGLGTVSFTPSTFDGGLPITSYTVISNPGNLTSSPSLSTSQTITGMAIDTAYTFAVYATNGAGDSVFSAYTGPAQFSTVPQTPTIGTLTDVGINRAFDNGAFTLTFTSGNVGGQFLTYTGTNVLSTPDNLLTSGSIISGTTVFTGFRSNIAYTLRVRRQNSNGWSDYSANSNSVVATTVPNKPAIPTATAGNTTASVSFTPLTGNNTGGKLITSYTVTSTPGTRTATGTTSPLSVTGLTNGTSYTFKVKATNANGTGFDSDASTAITPTAPAGPPPPPVDPPPVDPPPATNPPATNPPATNPPATNPPATNPPATNPPATPPPTGCQNPCPPPYFGCQDGGALCAI